MDIEYPQLYGLSSKHLVECQGVLLEQNTSRAFVAMQLEAKKVDIDIQICSGFRDFERQRLIWNNKVSGQRTLLDKDSNPIENLPQNKDELMKLILLWSALPGTSRHHWGTDLDIYDANQIDKQQLQLVAAEYQTEGPCYKLASWLKSHGTNFGFYLPFQAELSGVQPEPWHISYYPIATDYLKQFRLEQIKKIICNSDIGLKQEVINNLPEIVANYVKKVALPPS